MKSKLILAMLSLVLMSSCSIFKKINYDKEKLKLDSSTSKQTSSILIDTGSLKRYGKITIKAVSPVAGASPFSSFYPRGLVNSYNGMAEAMMDLNHAFSNTPGNMPKQKFNSSSTAPQLNQNAVDPVYDITIENWSTEQKGLTDIRNSAEETDLKKKLDNDNSVSEGSPKNVLILCIVAGFVIVILAIFLFLYYKSGKSLKDLFNFKK